MSRAAPQHPEGAQGDGVEPQHHQVASEEQAVEVLQEGQPPHLSSVGLVSGLEVAADGSELGPGFLQGPRWVLVLLREVGLCVGEEHIAREPGLPTALVASSCKEAADKTGQRAGHGLPAC